MVSNHGFIGLALFLIGSRLGASPNPQYVFTEAFFNSLLMFNLTSDPNPLHGIVNQPAFSPVLAAAFLVAPQAGAPDVREARGTERRVAHRFRTGRGLLARGRPPALRRGAFRSPGSRFSSAISEIAVRQRTCRRGS
jgi:hypothetical protein